MNPSVLLQSLNGICDDAKEYWEQLGIDGTYSEQKVKDEISEIEAFRNFLSIRFKHAIRVDDNIMMLRKPRDKEERS